MSDNIQESIEEFCRSHGLKELKIDCYPEEGQYVAEIHAVAGDGLPVKDATFGRTEAEAKSEAFKLFIEKVNQKALKSESRELMTTTSSAGGDQNLVLTPEIVNDDISQMANCVGKLIEICQKKGFKPPAYTHDQYGEPHSLTFVFVGTLEVNGYKIEGQGKGCRKPEAKNRAAQSLMRQLKEREANAQKASTGAFDISAYFKSRISIFSHYLEPYLSNKTLDYCQKLEGMALLLDCRLEYIPCNDVPNQVLLKVVIKESDYPLITTFGFSDKGMDYNREIAAMDAVLKLKTYTNVEN